MCDACPVGFGISTDDEMFVLIGAYVDNQPRSAGNRAAGAQAGRSPRMIRHLAERRRQERPHRRDELNTGRSAEEDARCTPTGNSGM